MIKYLFFLIITLNFINCSRFYKRTELENKYFEKSNKLILPSDVINKTDNYLNANIHWVGIIDSIKVRESEEGSIAIYYAEQKYWDYIEDFGAQKEKMFLSKFGEGKFI